ncbi:MAG: TerC/Alx family metal homeostasis membrane protein [Rickettsiales bacterium]|jgi:tellurite resistance protein TerC|nr:TerC/Alx family metal homeostasis membrane protein [Rickettsiales bacterium]
MQSYSITDVLGFSLIVALCLAIDLFAHKRDKEPSAKSAAAWTLFWIAVSLAFAMYIRHTRGAPDAYAFLAGYVLEKTLSIDNIFVIMAIFASFDIPAKLQHRVLYYGILGALVLRLVFVAAGGAFVEAMGGTALAVFGLFILWSAVKMMEAAGIWFLAWSVFKKEQKPQEQDFKNHWSQRFFKRLFPITPKLEGHRFFIGKAATPLFLCLLTIEFADIMFAFDSIPAVIAVTEKPFLIYTSNVFAILGMRSLYFCLAAAKRSLVHLEKAVVAILFFIGLKMLAEVFFKAHVSPGASLAVIFSMVAAGVAASLIWPGKKSENA